MEESKPFDFDLAINLRIPLRTLAENLRAAALEELRVRAAVERVRAEMFGWPSEGKP